MHINGFVKRTIKDKVIVVFSRSLACGECGKCLSLKQGKEIEVEVENIIGAQENDLVEINIEGINIFSTSLLLYALPLVLFLLGIALGYTFFSNSDKYVSLLSSGVGLTFMIIGSFFVYKLYKKNKKNLCSFKLVKVLKNG